LAKFAFFSTDIAATLDPKTAVPAPAILICLDRDPVHSGGYEPNAGSDGRGSVIPTLGGAVVQDFGFFDEDLAIKLSDTDAMSQARRDALWTISRVVDGRYYFTDGYECFEVAFLRPGGFRAWKNLYWAERGVMVFSYEIKLSVIEKKI